MEDTTMAVSDEVPQMSFFQRLIGIFLEPTKTFEDINRKATWIGIFIIMAILGMVVAYAMVSHIDTMAMMRQQMEAKSMSEAEITAAIEAQQGSSIIKYIMYLGVVFAPIAQILMYLIIAGVFLLIFMMMGAPLTFKKTLAVTIWGMSPAGIIMSVLSVVLIYVKNPDSVEMAQGVVMSNLGPLVNSKASPFLYGVLSSIDLFSFWTIVMLSIGFPTISGRKLTTQKTAIGVVILWVLYVLGKSGFRMLFPR